MTATRPPASSGTSDAATARRTRRRALWVVAASLTLLVAVAVGVTLGRSSAPQSAAATGGAEAIPSADAASNVWDVPTQVPADIRWERVEMPRIQTWIPVSTTYGPATKAVGEWTGWSQTPMGAVMAAHTITSGWGLDNHEAAAYAAAHMRTFPDYVSQSLAERPVDGVAPQVTIQPTGFRVDDYAVARATVTLSDVASLAGSPGTPSMLTVSLQWVDGDWKVIHTPEDHPRRSSTAPTGTFVTWGPQ